jgi:hypothetical protein
MPIVALEPLTNLDDLENSGTYAAVTPLNGPEAGKSYFIDVAGGNFAGVNHVLQIATEVGTNRKATRTKSAGWSTWNVEKESLTANRVYYVRTDGNDANNGLSDSPSGAFQTIAGALQFVARNISHNGYIVTLQLAAGTYVGAIASAYTSYADYGGIIRIVGDVSDASEVTLTPASTFATLGVEDIDMKIVLLGVTVDVNAVYPLYASGGKARMFIGYDPTGIFEDGLAPISMSGTPSTNANQSLFAALVGARMDVTPSVLTTNLSGPIRRFARTASRGTIDFYMDQFTNVQAVTINAVGIATSSYGNINWGPGATTLTGAFTGKRYDATGLSLITGTSDINSTFGATAGTTSGGAQAV